MSVTWVTWVSTGGSAVIYDFTNPPNPLTSPSAIGNETLYIDGGPEQRQYFIHRVIINSLTPGRKYCISFNFR